MLTHPTPHAQATSLFSSADASGSTSQAAAIIEALEAGASTLLIDEDTTATNFMIRDARMQALVAADKEPIKPFITRVRALHDQLGVSTVVVIGGSGDYFDVADAVVMLDCYMPSDVTARAKEIAGKMPGGAPPTPTSFFPTPPQRCPTPSGLSAGLKVNAGRNSIRFGELPELDLCGVEQIVEHSQVRAISEVLVYLIRSGLVTEQGDLTISELLTNVQAAIACGGLDAVAKPGWRAGNLAAPRMLEVAAALSRLRSLVVAQSKPDAKRARCGASGGGARQSGGGPQSPRSALGLAAESRVCPQGRRFPPQ